MPGERTDLECPDCGGRLRLRSSRHGVFYGCVNYPDCRGTHGAHPDGSPKGTPADALTRRLRIRAHHHFDQLWRDAHELPCYDVPDDPREAESAFWAIRNAARGRAYRWLAYVLGIDPEDCHIGMFDAEMCLRTIRYCRSLEHNTEDPRLFIRRWAKGAGS